MVRVQILKTKSNPKSINKVFTDSILVEGQLAEEVDVIRPSILLGANPLLNNIYQYNYVNIPDLKRFYFITDIIAVSKNLWRVELKIDVLYTYKDNIRQLQCVVEKQEGNAYSNQLYNDGSYRVREDNFTEIKTYPNGFENSGQFILMTAGAISSNT